MIILGTQQLRGGVNIFLFYKVSFEKHPNAHPSFIPMTHNPQIHSEWKSGGAAARTFDSKVSWPRGPRRRLAGGRALGRSFFHKLLLAFAELWVAAIRGAVQKKIRRNLGFCPNEGGGVSPNPNFLSKLAKT